MLTLVFVSAGAAEDQIPCPNLYAKAASGGPTYPDERAKKVRRLQNSDYYTDSPSPDGMGKWDFPGSGERNITASISQMHITLPNGQNHTIAIAIPLKFPHRKILEMRDAISDGLETLPLDQIEAVREIRVNTREYTQNDYFRKRYIDFDRAAATGGDGVIDYFPSGIINASPESVIQLTQHEFGHLLAWKLWGSSKPPGEYVRRMRLDQRSISSYGNNSPAEDWAELMMIYLQKAYWSRRSDFPNRYEFLDDILLPKMRPSSRRYTPSVEELRKKFFGN